MRVGSVVFGVEDLPRQIEFWTAALACVPVEPPGSDWVILRASISTQKIKPTTLNDCWRSEHTQPRETNRPADVTRSPSPILKATGSASSPLTGPQGVGSESACASSRRSGCRSLRRLGRFRWTITHRDTARSDDLLLFVPHRSPTTGSRPMRLSPSTC